MYELPTRLGVCTLSMFLKEPFLNTVIIFHQSVRLPRGAIRAVQLATRDTYGCNQHEEGKQNDTDVLKKLGEQLNSIPH